MSRSGTSFLILHKRTLLALIFLSVFSLTVVYAAPRTESYAPGDTLDPDCAPGEDFCSVEIPTGGGTPSGPDGAIQFNNIGSFGGNSLLVWDSGHNLLINGGTVDNGGVGNIVSGITTDGGIIKSSGSIGSISFGVADTTGTILNQKKGSLVFGDVELGGAIYANNSNSSSGGSIVGGYTTNSGEIYTGSRGTFTIGAVDGLNNHIATHEAGSAIFGVIDSGTGGSMDTYGYGSTIHGVIQDGAKMETNGYASTVFGFASGKDDENNPSYIQASGDATVTIGITGSGGRLLSGGGGSLVVGVSTGKDSLITTNGSGAFAGGFASSGRQIVSSGSASFAFGTDTIGNVEATADNSFAFGDGVLASGVASFAFGLNTSATENLAIAIGQNITNNVEHSFAVGFGMKQFIVEDGVSDGATNHLYLNADGSVDFAAVGGEMFITSDTNVFISGDSGDAPYINLDEEIAIRGLEDVIPFSINGTTGQTAFFQINTPGGNTCTFSTVTGLFSCASDIRLKNNITTIDTTDAFERISLLNPVTFNYNWQDQDDAPIPGFIAQEFEQVFPDMVSTNPRTGYKSLSYTGLIPYIVKGVQDINIRIAQLPVFEDQTFAANVAEFLRGISEGIARISRVETQELCLGDESDQVCVTKEQLRTLLEDQSALQSSPEPIVEEEIIPDEELSTIPDSVIEPIPEPVPEASEEETPAV